MSEAEDIRAAALESPSQLPLPATSTEELNARAVLGATLKTLRSADEAVHSAIELLELVLRTAAPPPPAPQQTTGCTPEKHLSISKVDAFGDDPPTWFCSLDGTPTDPLGHELPEQ